ncbi:MAG TPA: TonB-dependent receptor [Pseudomonadales bacterium]|nr:TonB-dependent receptor [Pseudomonadales bacterium]
MTSPAQNLRFLVPALVVALAPPGTALAAAEGGSIEELVVRGDASLARDFRSVGNFTRIDDETIDSIGIVHANEAFVRVPGVWVSRGSGQEHLTAIRSGVLTGAGACGAYLILENGVPIRPSGFCNVNNLFEVNTEQASGIEVVRGPASALYGGNALHGAINVLAPTTEAGGALELEGGPWDYARLSARVAADTDAGSVGVAFTGTTTDGWRDDTGHDQQKLSLTWDTVVGDWSVSTLLSGTNLNQETGGFVVGFESYKDDDLRDTNPNPEAYRDAWAVRLSSRWARTLDDGSELSVTPYLRSSDMTFLQHFLPGQPVEENGQDSGGLIARLGQDGTRLDWRVGTQLEYAQTFLKETQDGPTTGSPFLVATRPEGRHYDYDVDSTLLAAFYDLTWHLGERLDLVHSLRVESLRYEYDNHALVGNTRDDGTECGFGGCLYTRPADRDDDFTDAAGRLGLEYRVVDGVRTWVTAGIGHRAPQSTELYRLQRGQLVADVDSESVRSLEVGMDAAGETSSLSLVAYVERTEDEIIRDASGFNVSAGETSSRGVEFSMIWAPLETHSFDLIGTWAKHQYEFSRAIGGGETITKGNDVDTAPRWMGSAHWRWRPTETLGAELEGVYVGEYYVDAANTDEYEGHLIFNLRADWQALEQLSLSARLLNVLDEEYADRADLAFGNYRYFPGLPRRVHLTAEYQF